ncbi:MAG TPA: hypothetical protein VFR31_17495 [Thermoanaerobaculia bacterium]|nr:hypothetical protein [Thermoanaerobaculia bacterium]
MRQESRKATSKSAIAARARTLHAKSLAWLDGFPLAVEEGQVRWMSVPPAAPAREMVVDGRHLSRAVYALNKLRTELAAGLPRIADDPEAWLASMESRIALLKGAVHHGRPLPPADSLLDPFLSQRLGEQAGLVVTLRLQELAADHGMKRVEPLASCLFDERAWDVPLKDGTRLFRQLHGAIAKKSKAPLPEKLPSGSLGRELAAWCEELVQQSRRGRQQGLRLFELAAPLPLLESWAAWWETFRGLLREAEGLVRYGVGSRRGLKKRLLEHHEDVPPELAVSRLLDALRRMTEEPAPGRLPALLRVLQLAPDESRTRLFVYWSSLWAGKSIPEARVTALLAGFARYLDRSQMVRPWNGTRDDVEEEILQQQPPRRVILEVYDYLAIVTSRHPDLDTDGAVKAVTLFFKAGDPALAARFFDSLAEGGRITTYDTPRSTDLAIRLCRDRPERFADVLQALFLQEDRGELPPSAWPDSILEPLSSGDLGDFVREAVVTGQLARLVACAAKSALVEAAGELPRPDLGQPVEPDWLERYPAQLHPALRRLAAVLPDAEAQAARSLGTDFPDTGKLRREIETIESRLESSSALLKRLANLRERIEQPSVPGPGRLERLRAKLDRAWGRAILDRWERELDERLPEALVRLLGIAEAPSWLAEPRNLVLLAAAVPLSERRRAVAYRMFAVRCGPPPWDLRDAPQNRAFLESLPRLDWSPWIDGVGTVTLESPRRLHLSLEDDPLEVFRMGGHFQTCLSPGAGNYYSVFTNAADINKRVLYARDDSGRIVGRCLLAVTATGGMLRFEAYCHDGSLDFGKICSDFAGDLARRMGTELVSSGRVPALVGADWYDDGAHDFGERFPVLEEGSPLRRRLTSLPPEELLGELRRALKPARLDEATLPLVLELSELEERPELIVPLLRPVAECPVLPEEALLTAAALGLEAGEEELVRRLLLERVFEHLREPCRAGFWVDQRAVDVALRLDPVRLIDLLRRTRSKPVRHWLEEDDGVRLEIAAQTLEALHRPGQARELWRRLASSQDVHADLDQRQRARAAVARLS